MRATACASRVFAALLALLAPLAALGELRSPAAQDVEFTVDIEWKNGKVTTYCIRPAQPREVNVLLNGEAKNVRAESL